MGDAVCRSGGGDRLWALNAALYSLDRPVPTLRHAVSRPIVHQLSAFGQSCAASVCCLRVVAGGMRYCSLSDFPRVGRFVPCPIPEGRAHAVCCGVSFGVARDAMRQRGVRNRLEGKLRQSERRQRHAVFAFRLHATGRYSPKIGFYFLISIHVAGFAVTAGRQDDPPQHACRVGRVF